MTKGSLNSSSSVFKLILYSIEAFSNFELNLVPYQLVIEHDVELLKVDALAFNFKIDYHLD